MSYIFFTNSAEALPAVENEDNIEESTDCNESISARSEIANAR